MDQVRSLRGGIKIPSDEPLAPRHTLSLLLASLTPSIPENCKNFAMLSRDIHWSLKTVVFIEGLNIDLTVSINLKGHDNEADFLGFLQKLDPHRSLKLPFAPFRFWL